MHPRIDPTYQLSDFEFKRHFRFNKESVNRLAGMLDLERPSGRGVPLTPVQTLCIALNHFGGAHFNRISAYCGNVSYFAAWTAIDRVREALCGLKEQYICMPTYAQMDATARRMLERFKLPRMAYAVDGMFVRFDGAVRGLRQGPGLPNLQNFFTRKLFYGIPTMVVANDLKLIHALDVDWHGAAHDARIWRESVVKPVIEEQRHFLLAGDSAYPISDVLMKPYSNQEARHSPRKRLFNTRFCGLRTVMSENVYGVWKSRFPCLRNLRCHYENAKKTIVATAVLHNISILWNDAMPEDEPEVPEVPDDEQFVVVEDRTEPHLVRQRGQAIRDQLCAEMPPRGRCECVA